MSNERDGNGVSRRSFIQTLGLSAAAGAVEAHGAPDAPAADALAGVAIRGPAPFETALRVNGRARPVRLETGTTLAEALRADLGLTGTKEVCDRGACGACSVLVDGKLVASCMMLAVDAEDAEITTVEGLASGETLDPVQQAFIRHDALQCGFCTPGLLVACRALLAENPRPTLPEIQRGLSGNLCRCGTYPNVFNAVLTASGQAPVQEGGDAS